MAWTFDGVLLPSGESGRLEVAASPGASVALLAPLPGRFCLPGLTDAHAHLTVRPDHTLGDERLAKERLVEYAALGVGLVRDVGGDSSVTLALAASPTHGVPMVRAAGSFLAPPRRYFPGLHAPVPAEGLVEAACDQIAAGATWVKVIGDFALVGASGPVPGSLAPTYGPGLLAQVVQAAHARGARVAVHTQSSHADELVDAGVDSVEHGEWLTEDGVQALGARGGAWTPTLGAITEPPANASQTRRRYAAEASERLRTLLPLAVQSGVHVLAGTDLATTLPREVALLVRHGLEPTEALAAASTAAANWIDGHAPIHTLVTYHSDPREDPDILTTPAAVVVNGSRVR